MPVMCCQKKIMGIGTTSMSRRWWKYNYMEKKMVPSFRKNHYPTYYSHLTIVLLRESDAGSICTYT